MERIFKFSRWSQLIHRHYLVILSVAAATALVGGYLASKLTLQSDLADLLPETFESVKALNQIRDEVGGVGNLRIALVTHDFDAAKRFAEHLEPRLLNSSFVNNVDYQNDVAFYKEHALLYLSLDELDSLHATIRRTIDSEKQKLNPLYVEDLFGIDETDESADLAEWESKYKDFEPKEFYTNADSSVLVIQVSPSSASTDITYIRNMLADVDAIIEQGNPQAFDPAMVVYYGGNIKTRLDEFDLLRSDIAGTAVYGFGGVFLLIVLYFRRLSGAVLITITLLFSLCWTFGVTYLVIGSLNTITGFLFVILFGLGIDYGIHAFARYAELRGAGSGVEEAIETLVARTGTALSTTAVTTSAAFLSLVFMDFKGFSDLGFIAGIGMLFALVAMIIVLPALITLVERLQILRIRPDPRKGHPYARRELRYARPIIFATGVVTFLAVAGFVRVDFEYDFTNLRGTNRERTLFGENTRGVFTRSESPGVVLAASRDEVKEIVDAVEAKGRLDTLTPTVEAVRSVFSLVPEDQDRKLERIRAIRDLVEDEAADVVGGEDKNRLDRLREYLQVEGPFVWEDLPEKDRQQFVTKRGDIGNLVFIYPSVALRDGRNAIEFRNDIGQITTASGQTFYASSSQIVTAELLLVMIREGKIAVLLTFVVVFLIVLADFRNLRDTILVLTPLVVGVVLMGGVMFLLGMKLNFFNIVVFPSIVGIGVDNGVHILHRYKEEGPGSLYHVLRHTGWAITMTTSTTIVGYSGLILASHPGLQSIGDLAIIGLGATYVTAMIVLPALLQFTEKQPAVLIEDRSGSAVA